MKPLVKYNKDKTKFQFVFKKRTIEIPIETKLYISTDIPVEECLSLHICHNFINEIFNAIGEKNFVYSLFQRPEFSTVNTPMNSISNFQNYELQAIKEKWYKNQIFYLTVFFRF